MYNSAGDLARYTDADGRVTTYQYNPQGELTTETWYADAADANAGQNVEDTFHYTYNSAGLMTSESDNTLPTPTLTTPKAGLSRSPSPPQARRPSC